MDNILVHEGKIVAIIDWEFGGYYPWWVEIFMSYHRAVSTNAAELFDSVWEELGMDIFAIHDRVDAVINVWWHSPVCHTGSRDYWQRPVFCKCHPYGGIIYRSSIDSEERHFVNYNEPNRYGETPLRSEKRVDYAGKVQSLEPK